MWPRLLGITLCATSSACEKGHKPKRALGRLTEMQGRGLEPNVTTYHATIGVYEKGQCPERTLSLLTETCGLVLKLNVISFSATISVCEMRHHPQNSLELLAEMEGRGWGSGGPVTRATKTIP